MCVQFDEGIVGGGKLLITLLPRIMFIVFEWDRALVTVFAVETADERVSKDTNGGSGCKKICSCV